MPVPVHTSTRHLLPPHTARPVLPPLCCPVPRMRVAHCDMSCENVLVVRSRSSPPKFESYATVIDLGQVGSCRTPFEFPTQWWLPLSSHYSESLASCCQLFS
jgi:hypothetical protein